jgi:hypothetical protein
VVGRQRELFERAEQAIVAATPNPVGDKSIGRGA